MKFREAVLGDIAGMHKVRVSVKENVLSDPGLVTIKDYEDYVVHRGKGWVCEINNEITGFGIIDLLEKNVWALFVKPAHEGKGIGRKLHQLMLDWYFSKTLNKIWLGTEPGSRAAAFYETAGWKQVGTHGKNELKFEITAEEWKLSSQ